MFTDKENVLQTVALLKAYGISRIVISPGARNAPLIHAFAQDPYFICHTIVDERNAGFYALGMTLRSGHITAVCCTSGSALLNYAPAVAEAYYQQVPMVVISADRPAERIGQLDGQTLPQPGIFGTMVKLAVDLPEIHTDTDRWHCNRLINEALSICQTRYAGPVHINIPISDPLFNCTVEQLPEVRHINSWSPNIFVRIRPDQFELWNNTQRKMLLIGQMRPNSQLYERLSRLASEAKCAILCEHLANCNNRDFIHRFDAVLADPAAAADPSLAPEMVITFGGHVVSKRIREFLERHRPKHHWHISLSDRLIDTYHTVTDHFKGNEGSVVSQLLDKTDPNRADDRYQQHWYALEDQLAVDESDGEPFTGLYAIGQMISVLPNNSELVLGNGLAVRQAQRFWLSPHTNVYCNRGVSGIEGTLATALGIAAVGRKPIYLIIGDQSFAYGINALWNIRHIKNLRILLINNGGGGIFRTLPGLNGYESLEQHIVAAHTCNAAGWAEAAGMEYQQTDNAADLEWMLTILTQRQSDRSILLEAIVEK